MDFAVGDIIEHPMFSKAVYRVVAVLEPDPRGADLVLVNTFTVNSQYFLDRSSEYKKIKLKFEAGKRYKHEKSRTTFEVVGIREDMVIGWKFFDDDRVVGFTSHQNNRIYWEEIK